MKRLVYEKNHWDEAIIGFRETERKNWNKVNSEVIQRLRQNAFKPDVKHLPHVHVLDLAEDGHIKPHIDSPRVCFELLIKNQIILATGRGVILEDFWGFSDFPKGPLVEIMKIRVVY